MLELLIRVLKTSFLYVLFLQIYFVPSSLVYKCFHCYEALKRDTQCPALQAHRCSNTDLHDRIAIDLCGFQVHSSHIFFNFLPSNIHHTVICFQTQQRLFTSALISKLLSLTKFTSIFNLCKKLSSIFLSSNRYIFEKMIV